METASQTPKARATRAWQVALVLIIAVAFTGYFVGIHQTAGVTPEAERPTAAFEHEAPARPSEAQAVPVAVPYRQMAEFRRRLGVSAAGGLTSLKPPSIPNEPPPPASEAEIAAALAKRSSRRAFNGAPPTVPHPIDQHDSHNCLICHGEGVVVGELIAPKMCHEPLAACTQCHVEGSAFPEPLGPTLPPAVPVSTFEGVEAPLSGTRSYPGAPPTIPHPVWMREQCTSCHSSTGGSPLRPSHSAWQTDCQQCHASSAELEQLPFLNSGGW